MDMTIEQKIENPRNDFSKWLREVKELDSKKGYLFSDLDMIGKNYKTKKFLTMEIKCFNSEPKTWQRILLDEDIRDTLKSNPNYLGHWYIKFEHYGPSDGRIWIKESNDNQYTEKTEKELVEFLKGLGEFEFTEF
jgi:hypothetical protein